LGWLLAVDNAGRGFDSGDSGGRQPGIVAAAAVVQGQLPSVLDGVLTHQVDAAVVTPQLEVAVAGVEPPVDDLCNDHRSLSEPQAPGLGIATVTGITVDTEKRIIVSATILLRKHRHRDHERELVERPLAGTAIRETAKALGISPLIVDAHRRNLLSKFGADSTEALLGLWAEISILSLLVVVVVVVVVVVAVAPMLNNDNQPLKDRRRAALADFR
jgi:DNA-binding CsgD family transcriptional regulator